MNRKRVDSGDPKVIEAVLKRIHSMTREEWIKWLAWRPVGYQDPDDAGGPAVDAGVSEGSLDDASVATSPKVLAAPKPPILGEHS